ncbi:HdeD family acid-resistance protein [Thermaurantiacus sp.]
MAMGTSSDAAGLAERLEAGGLALMRTRWWALALRGLFAVIFGVLAFVTPVAALLSLVLVFGIFAVADGIVGVVGAFGRARNGESWGWMAVGAVASIVLGVLAFLMPGLTAKALTLLVTAHAAVFGVIFLVSAVRFDGDHGRWWLVAAGVSSLIFAILIFMNPLAGAIAMTWVIGGWAIVLGVLMIALGFKLRSARKTVEAKIQQLRSALERQA